MIIYILGDYTIYQNIWYIYMYLKKIKVVLCTVFIAKSLAVTVTYFKRLPFIMKNDKQMSAAMIKELKNVKT